MKLNYRLNKNIVFKLTYTLKSITLEIAGDADVVDRSTLPTNHNCWSYVECKPKYDAKVAKALMDNLNSWFNDNRVPVIANVAPLTNADDLVGSHNYLMFSGKPDVKFDRFELVRLDSCKHLCLKVTYRVYAYTTDIESDTIFNKDDDASNTNK